MEPSGRQRGQSVADGTRSQTAQIADPQAVAIHCNRFGAHGKEEVDGSRPSEGLRKASKWPFLLPRRRTYIARASLNLSPRSLPNIALALQSLA